MGPPGIAARRGAAGRPRAERGDAAKIMMVMRPGVNGSAPSAVSTAWHQSRRVALRKATDGLSRTAEGGC